MAPEKRTPDQIQRELAAERDGLSAAVDNLREEANVGRKLKAKLPVAAAGALGAGFFLAGGIGATVRLLFRRGRE
ncbi:MAG: hypothetical protein QOG29_1985 [Gaiellaceae bacterium]|jgi:hypothetical protein|nr:hypothetical protein [Gaiellaceae bacterium]MDX6479398.1 hypothetical protein [Gaiellaceae bacterium]MDX6483316.1 hypothetical protein [Gaiellaceae bacterium]MDX6488541.1 hypothetical protein [Gaiellaceae bacterium]MDX6542494.1 hypothetical protein [Gaiellaceae bacterium]